LTTVDLHIVGKMENSDFCAAQEKPVCQVSRIIRFVPEQSLLKARKLLRALRDTATTIPLRQLETAERQAAVPVVGTISNQAGGWAR
jgi:hypothetical protein